MNFRTALFQGQAPDKGLYVPEKIPTLPSEIIQSMRRMSYPEIATTVLGPWLEAEIPSVEIRRMAYDAYNFEVPLQKIDGGRSVLWLDRGPTRSFKDLGVRMMARLMQYYSSTSESTGDSITICTATSGDTGSAVASAFYGLDGINCVVLFPRNEVTELQRKQMTTLGGNVIAIAVDGKFDDCQAMVKQAFADRSLQSLNLTSANSINFGRLLPQSIQFFHTYARAIGDYCDELVISVPSGNFGHLTAGLIAKHMGLPAHKFIAATNANDEFPEFLRTGVYKPIAPSRDCISNAMNVGHPSNLARIINMYKGTMDEKGQMIEPPNINALRRDVFSVSISDEETRETIRTVYKDYGTILDPHGAVAWAGLTRYLETEAWWPCVSFETASPGKFSEQITKTLGISPKLPDALKMLQGRKESYITISNDYGAFKRELKGLVKK